jgi:hypothetical protein
LNVSQTDSALRENPAAQHATEFANTLHPQDKVDYEWVLEVAKGRYDALVKAFEDLDNKAAAIVGYLGSGTGLITLGTLFTALNAAVSPWVAAAALFPIGFAAAALLCACRARETDTIHPPPTVEELVKIANEFGEDAAKAKAVMAAQWDVCTALMRPVVARKGKSVDDANWMFAWAVLTLALPLLVHIGFRFAPH